MNLEQLHAHKAHLERVHAGTMNAINAQIALAIRKRKVSCTACPFRGVIGDWTFVQTFYFSSQAQFYLEQWSKHEPEECFVICPICGIMTKISEHLYHTEFTETVKERDISPQQLFAKVLAKYGDNPIEQIQIEHD